MGITAPPVLGGLPATWKQMGRRVDRASSSRQPPGDSVARMRFHATLQVAKAPKPLGVVGASAAFAPACPH